MSAAADQEPRCGRPPAGPPKPVWTIITCFLASGALVLVALFVGSRVFAQRGPVLTAVASQLELGMDSREVERVIAPFLKRGDIVAVRRDEAVVCRLHPWYAWYLSGMWQLDITFGQNGVELVQIRDVDGRVSFSQGGRRGAGIPTESPARH